MNFFISSKKIPELKELTYKDKQKIIYLAQQKLTVPEKLLLNIIKLIILIPPFLFLARTHWLELIIALIFSTVCYLVIFKPISFIFLKKHFQPLIDSL